MRERRAVATRKRRNEKQRIHQLCEWFEAHARNLPWRARRTGYRALVAELMLQQTQVSRVVERYAAFLKRFPTVHSLAAAEEHDLLHLWQGLGYYRRARLLHAAAKVIVSDFGGRVPCHAEVLRQLPGVGRYTAGAIASIVYGEPEPIVDGNVQRVLARWYGRRGGTDDAVATQWTWQAADDLVKQSPQPGRFNEALMELGSLVCAPRSPRCGECPVARQCEARKAGLQHEIPAPKARARQTVRHHHAVVITRGGKMLVEQRNTNGMWAGMWQTPTIESTRPMRLSEIKKALPIDVNDVVRCGTFEHNTSHRAIRFHVYRAHSKCRAGTWRAIAELADLPMSNAQRKVLRHAG